MMNAFEKSSFTTICDRAAVPQDSAEQNEWLLHNLLEYQLKAGVGERNQALPFQNSWIRPW